jgi:heptosyltransferase-2
MPLTAGKILVIRLSSLGDIILLAPELLRLRNAAPAAVIHLLTRERYAGLFDGNTYLDEVLTLGRGGLGELARVRRRLARERYDVLVDAHGVLRSGILFHSLHAPKKVRIRKNGIAKFALIAGKTNLYRGVVTQSRRYARLFEALGLDAGGEDVELPVPPRAVAGADAALSRAAPGAARLVAFAPGARWETKTWPRRHYADLMRLAAARGYATLLIGGPADAEANAGIAKSVSPAPLDLTGRLSILESAAVLKRSAALVTNDSAPLHLAEAVGTPVVAFFGPTVRDFGYFPRLARSVALEVHLRCRPCSRNGARRCPYGTKECLAAISPQRAMDALAGLLGEPEVSA